MSIEYCNTGCCKPSIKITNTGHMSTIEKLCYVIEKTGEVIEFVNGFQDELDSKEDSVNITNIRKLSEVGDFTGTWFGESKSSMDAKDVEGLNNYQALIEYLQANPQIGWIVWDGKFFATVEDPDEELDGGLFTESVTEETDCGKFIYSCACLG